MTSGPLQGLKVIEMAGLGPAPFCAMMFADMGAEVVRIERPGSAGKLSEHDVTVRGRTIVELDLRQGDSAAKLLQMIAGADVLIEGFRPGVMERLGLGPQICHGVNPKLVFGRMTGWGQDGPLASTAGHDINYISLTGVLNAIGQTNGPPVMPLNLVGDFGGGGMLLAFGVLAACLEARQSGKGQIVDAAMTDGSALLSAMMWGFRSAGMWSNQRGSNLLDGGAPFYGVYECADGNYVGVGSIEPQFYAQLMQRCDVNDPQLLGLQRDTGSWPEQKLKLAAIFKAKTRDEWVERFADTDACVSPILDWDEAQVHPHNVARETFIDLGGVVQPAPAPKFSRTPGQAQSFIVKDFEQVFRAWTEITK
jgi:alpha-methylacyl-CoA racemase